MSFKQITIMGFVGKDPEIKTLASGARVASFSVAVGEKYKDKAGNQQEKTTWFRVDAWQQQATGIVTSLVQPHIKKGQQIFVQGTPEIEEFEKDGVKKQAFKIRLGGPGSTIRLCGSAKDKGDAHEAPASTAAPAADLGDDIPF